MENVNVAGQQPPLDDLFDFSAALQPLRNMEEGGFHTAVDPTSFSPLQATAWPWLHEDMFFQNGAPNDRHQLLLDDPKSGGNSAHQIPLDSISDKGINLNPPSAVDDFSREHLERAAPDNTTQPVPETRHIQPTRPLNSTSPTRKSQGFSQKSKLSQYCPLLASAS
jgi:hypothetical protein